jgi:hypothetical protein
MNRPGASPEDAVGLVAIPGDLPLRRGAAGGTPKAPLTSQNPNSAETAWQAAPALSRGHPATPVY